MDTKPQAEKPVLAWDGKEWVRAMWVPKHTREQNTDSDWYTYNEADDTYYWPEGWYELQTHGGDAILWHLTDGAAAWQELPPAPLLNTGGRRQFDAPADQIVELAEALQVRRILDEVKKVAAIHPAGDMPTAFQAAWQQCCEEIFYRATGEEWHMDEDANRFARRLANSEVDRASGSGRTQS